MTICIIHTGGTIAMRQGPQGLYPSAGVLEAGLAGLARAGIVPSACQITALEPLIDSANIRFQDWNRIAQIIVQGQDRYRGFVVTHGTDTLAFTAAALGFCLTGLSRPVIVTGAMLPFDAPGSDARGNLGDALIAARHAPAGIWVQFAGKLMQGARVRKAHSHAQDAFCAVPPAAEDAPARRAGPLAHLPYGAQEIAVLTMAPNMSARAFAAALSVCDGAVLWVFGAGTLPDDPQISAALLAAKARGALMIAVSQCESGGMMLGAYAAGAVMAQAGVVDGGQITLEAAYAKLAHALAHGGETTLRAALCGEI